MNQLTPEQIAALTEFLRDTYRIRKAETMKITLTGVLLVVAIERLQHLAVAGSLYSVVKDWYRDTTGRELQVITYGGACLYTVSTWNNTGRRRWLCLQAAENYAGLGHNHRDGGSGRLSGDAGR